MEKTIAMSESLTTGFVTAEESAALTQMIELALEDTSHVAAALGCICCLVIRPVPIRIAVAK
jgi:hypothetical protein